MPNGDILDILKDRISTELGKKRISSANKTQLEVLQLFVTYLEMTIQRLRPCGQSLNLWRGECQLPPSPL